MSTTNKILVGFSLMPLASLMEKMFPRSEDKNKYWIDASPVCLLYEQYFAWEKLSSSTNVRLDLHMTMSPYSRVVRSYMLSVTGMHIQIRWE